ncbi:MAG: hypothetical protein SFW36_21360 [Leptolyngbyaceae cyanobacterium bins.59]|nr:hypothetical protein [Leptolyngbyaceae cyanobacterium bins.59]
MASNLHHILFYGIAISGVVVLFRGVATHGEANLKAPPKIDGTFKIETVDSQSCLKPNMLLIVEQSGVYLSGALLPADPGSQAITIAQKQPSLQGRWQNQGMTLSGPVNGISGCEGFLSVQIQGTFIGPVLQAKLISNQSPIPVQFQAQRQVEVPDKSGGGH